jgi:hypothetical protein
LALTFAALPARAADPIFPLGSRVGLVPPDGMKMSHNFAGFADPNEDAAILMTTLPAEAYGQIERTFDADALKKQGFSIEKREPIKLGVGTGFLVVGRQTAKEDHYRKWLLVVPASDLTALISVQIPDPDKDGYSDALVRAALATLAVRASVPEQEELGLLPFTIGDLAGFHIAGVLPGRAIMLGDPPAELPKEAQKEPPADASKEPPKEAPPAGAEVRMLIAAVPGGPSEFDDRANFARLNFNEIGGINDIHDVTSEPLRVGGQSGYQTLAQAKDVHTGNDVNVVQWLRFGSGGFLQMTGIARREKWANSLSRLRAVRDSVELK